MSSGLPDQRRRPDPAGQLIREAARPSHPHLPAALLMVGVSLFLLLAAALGVG